MIDTRTAAIRQVFEGFVQAGGTIPFGTSAERIASHLADDYAEDDVKLARGPTGELCVAVLIPDGLHCTEDPDPQYELCYSLGQVEPVTELSPRNAGLAASANRTVRYQVRAEALNQIGQAVRFLIPVERYGWTDARTGQRL